MIYFWIGCAIFYGILLWGVYCSNNSYHERNAALGDKRLTWADILEVDFFKHVWYRFTFRNPWKLYSQWVQVRLKKD
jgi:hypothetical protein